MVTLEEMRAAVEAVVAENPDRTNNGACRYVVRNENNELVPNCVAAVVLHDKFGVAVNELASADSMDSSGILSLVEYCHEAVAVLDEDAATFLADVQAAADQAGWAGDAYRSGVKKWSDALSTATGSN